MAAMSATEKAPVAMSAVATIAEIAAIVALGIAHGNADGLRVRHHLAILHLARDLFSHRNHDAANAFALLGLISAHSNWDFASHRNDFANWPLANPSLKLRPAHRDFHFFLGRYV